MDENQIVTGQMQQCATHCSDCSLVCEEAKLQAGANVDRPLSDRHRLALEDCVAMCRLAADFLLRASDMHNRVCELCSEICHRCAEECEAFPDDGHMKSCAATCRICSEACKEIAIAGASA